MDNIASMNMMLNFIDKHLILKEEKESSLKQQIEMKNTLIGIIREYYHQKGNEELITKFLVNEIYGKEE